MIGASKIAQDIKAQVQPRAAIAESEERYRALFASASMAIFVCDRNAVIQDYNNHAAELWGREPVRGVEQHCGSVKLWLPNGSLLPHAQSPLGEVLRTGIPAYNVEMFIERPGGSRLPVLVNFAPLKNTEGEVTGAITSFVDITERKRAAALQMAHTRALELTVENAPVAQVLDALVRTLEAQCPGMLGSILLLDGDGCHLRHGAAPSLPEAYNETVDGIAIGPSVGSCGTAAYTKKSVYVADTATDPLWIDFRELALLHKLRACWSTPILSRSGEVLGTFAMYYGEVRAPAAAELHIVDIATRTASLIIERRRDEEALRASEQRLNDLISALPAAVYTTDAQGRITFYNQAAVELAGREPKIGSDECCSAWRLHHPDGTPMRLDECPMAVALNKNRPINGVEAIAERPDGTHVPVMLYPTLLRDAAGALAGGVNMLIDITERKQAEQRQKLLVDELNHRVKNTLATVQSIAAQLLKGTSDVELRETFDGRLVALSRTHDLLVRDSWEAASLRDLLLQEFEPYRFEEGARFVVEGPNLGLNPKAALTLGMAFHELTTNAAKYGALSRPAGQVRVTWEVLRASGPSALRLKWMETGGPPVKKRQHKGFGSTLIERGLSLELEGEVRVRLRSKRLDLYDGNTTRRRARGAT